MCTRPGQHSRRTPVIASSAIVVLAAMTPACGLLGRSGPRISYDGALSETPAWKELPDPDPARKATGLADETSKTREELEAEGFCYLGTIRGYQEGSDVTAFRAEIRAIASARGAEILRFTAADARLEPNVVRENRCMSSQGRLVVVGDSMESYNACTEEGTVEIQTFNRVVAVECEAYARLDSAPQEVRALWMHYNRRADLLRAVQSEDREVVAKLVADGVGLDHPVTPTDTALTASVEAASPDFVRAMLELGARPDASAPEGRRALDILLDAEADAVRVFHTYRRDVAPLREKIRLLVAHGADPTHAADRARDLGLCAVTDMLLGMGAQTDPCSADERAERGEQLVNVLIPALDEELGRTDGVVPSTEMLRTFLHNHSSELDLSSSFHIKDRTGPPLLTLLDFAVFELHLRSNITVYAGQHYPADYGAALDRLDAALAGITEALVAVGGANPNVRAPMYSFGPPTMSPVEYATVHGLQRTAEVLRRHGGTTSPTSVDAYRSALLQAAGTRVLDGNAPNAAQFRGLLRDGLEPTVAHLGQAARYCTTMSLVPELLARGIQPPRDGHALFDVMRGGSRCIEDSLAAGEALLDAGADPHRGRHETTLRFVGRNSKENPIPAAKQFYGAWLALLARKGFR